ncbi:hypothetical protein KIPB_008630 [Kipferlia bialata]|uniref:Tetratricopeptide repeat protein n=1 Tax=Kipferlia bialata TaxID=797122 RepID=A0A391NXM4_9EUKA|nr:hypothetical protein KIPB_008630 [Kipferlia bialata]|eukprot:g8630.t1
MGMCIESLESELGFQHPTTAQAYQQMALFLQEIGDTDAAAPLIRRAFVVLYIMFGADSALTQQVHEQLKLIETAVDSGLENVPVDELKARIEEIDM